MITSQDIRKLESWPDAIRDAKGRLRVGAAVGVKDTLQRVEALIKVGVDVIVLDVAHAHSDLVIERLRELKNNYNIDVMVGNIATVEAAEDVIRAGADGLKVGIGPSPVCITRTVSGAGIPQLTAILDVYSVAKKYNIPVTADGGMKCSGDIAKAIGAGASTIYSGSFFAGTDEAPGRIIIKEGKQYKLYAGSASYDSNHQRREQAQGTIIREEIDTFVEGVATIVDYKGPVSKVIGKLLKGLRSGMSYCGARTIPQMQQKAEFIQVTYNGVIEAGSRGMKLSE